MALDPVQHIKKKTQNDIVAHAGAWAQDQVAPHPPSPPSQKNSPSVKKGNAMATSAKGS
ncbi:hypothetical protein CEP53_005468 [Fusarium sp. AF-6]|nr:hypothetical protein CEP53_005468 [Fusarium sp. AF-6]